jgi:hypothetical protein
VGWGGMGLGREAGHGIDHQNRHILLTYNFKKLLFNLYDFLVKSAENTCEEMLYPHQHI